MAYEYRKFQHPAFPEIDLYKRKDSDDAPWQYYFYVSQEMNNGGKAFTERKSTRTNDKIKAIKFAAAAYVKITEATDDGEQVTLSGLPTLDDAYHLQCEEYRRNIIADKTRPGTLENYEKYYQREFAPLWGNKEVRSIDNQAWDKFLTDLIKRKPHLTANSIRLTKVALRKTLKMATRKGWIDATPTLDDGMRSPQSKRRAWFHWTEQKKLLAALDANINGKTRKSDLYNAQSMRDFAHMMLYTGVRPGELRVMKFHDVTLHRDRDKYGNYYEYTRIEIPDVPGAKKRSRPATDGVEGSGEAFRRIMERRGCANNSNELLFDRNHLNKFRELLEENDLRFDKHGKKRDFESLRHTFVCMRLLEGADVYWLANNMGHEIKVLQKEYAIHLSESIRKDYAAYTAKLAKRKMAAAVEAKKAKSDPDIPPVMKPSAPKYKYESAEQLQRGKEIHEMLTRFDQMGLSEQSEAFADSLGQQDSDALSYYYSTLDD